MLRIYLVVMLCCGAASLAWAGPNAGGTIVAHDAALAYTTDWMAAVPRSSKSGRSTLLSGPEAPRSSRRWPLGSTTIRTV